MNKEYSAGGVIFRKEEKKIFFLIIYSARNKIWGHPKGHIEYSETENETAKREIAEETGLKDLKIMEGFRAEDVYEAVSNQWPFKGQRIEKHSIYFLIQTQQKNVVVDNQEISDYKWLEFDHALALIGFDSAKGILKQADSFLNKNL